METHAICTVTNESQLTEHCRNSFYFVEIDMEKNETKEPTNK